MGHTSEISSVAQLTEAFEQFSTVSQQLVSSYSTLEDSVGELSRQLSAERHGRASKSSDKQQLAARMEQILDAMPAALIVLDGNGIVQQCNALAVDFLGSPLLGVLWRDVVARAFDRVELGDIARLRDARLVAISTTPLGNEPGQILLMQDVTEKNAVHETVHRQQRLASMGELAASLAHQVRTPLASSLLYVAKLERETLAADERRRCVAKIKTSLNHLERTVEDMLAFARGGVFHAEEIKVSALLSDVRDLLEAYAAERHCLLEVSNQARGAVILGNREAVLGAIQNLVINAVESLAIANRESRRTTSGLAGAVSGAEELVDRGRIVVTAIISAAPKVEQSLEIRVTDNGPGISSEDATRVFEPFFTTKPQGTGLGLAVVKAITKAHGGVVWLVPDQECGATFVLSLPIGTKTVRKRKQRRASLKVASRRS